MRHEAVSGAADARDGPGEESFYLGTMRTDDLVPTQHLTHREDIQEAAAEIRRLGRPGRPLAISYTHAKGQEGNPRPIS